MRLRVFEGMYERRLVLCENLEELIDMMMAVPNTKNLLSRKQVFEMR